MIIVPCILYVLNIVLFRQQLYDNVPYSKHLPIDRYNPPSQTGAPPPSRPSMGYPPQLQSQYHPSPPYTSTPQPDYAYAPPSSAVNKPYPQPVPASYTTASTPTGPRFTVQVKTAQPVTYSQSGRQAEQAYTPPPPRQHVSGPPQQDRSHYPDSQGQGWYPPPPPPAQEPHGDPSLYKGGSGSMPGGRAGQGPPIKRGQDEVAAYQPNKVRIVSFVSACGLAGRVWCCYARDSHDLSELL